MALGPQSGGLKSLSIRCTFNLSYETVSSSDHSVPVPKPFRLLVRIHCRGCFSKACKIKTCIETIDDDYPIVPVVSVRDVFDGTGFSTARFCSDVVTVSGTGIFYPPIMRMTPNQKAITVGSIYRFKDSNTPL